MRNRHLAAATLHFVRRTPPPLHALLLGLAHAFAFAPWGNDWLELLILACYAGLLRSTIRRSLQAQRAHRSSLATASRNIEVGGPPPARAPSRSRWHGWRTSPFLLGLMFGLGWFGAGISWIYISMHDYGGVPAPLALVGVLLFACYLSLYPALGSWLCARLCLWPSHRARHLPSWYFAVAFAGCLTLTELARGWVFTGFPWLDIGYALVDSPLSGFAPLGGVYLVTLSAALTAACLMLASHRLQTLHHHRIHRATHPCTDNPRPRRTTSKGRPIILKSALPGLLVALAILTLGGVLKTKEWSHPSGKPLSVSLLQGNVPQQLKFDPAQSAQARLQYLQMIEAAAADLILLPETAWTIPWPNTESGIQQRLHRFILETGSTVAIGLPRLIQQESSSHAAAPEQHWQISNSVSVQGPQTVAAQGVSSPYHYDKRHLVPFGEFIPTGFHWFMNIMAIPLGDQMPGQQQQPALLLKDQRIAFNICYEDIFGEDLLTQVRGSYTLGHRQKHPDGATLLANLTNLGWFGRSAALPQHLQIARMRAIETARPIIRATNTGMTAILSPHGAIQIVLRPHEVGTLTAQIRGYTGLTPYVRLGGNAPVAILSLALLFIPVLTTTQRCRRRRKPRSHHA